MEHTRTTVAGNVASRTPTRYSYDAATIEHAVVASPENEPVSC